MNDKSRLQEAYAQPLTTLFSAKVADYVAARPDYPAALFDWLAARLPARPELLDLGAGTGLLTQGLLARGWPVLAVEPDEGMRAACEARLGGRPGYRSQAGQAESLPAADASIDLITAAQCFHWFDIPRAQAECRRVLKPGGRVALIWHDRDSTDPLQRELDRLLDTFGGERRAALVAQEDMEEDTRIAAFYAPLSFDTWRGPHTHRLDAAGLEALAFSRSYMPARDSEAGRRALEALRQLFERHAEQGRVTMRYRTLCHLG